MKYIKFEELNIRKFKHILDAISESDNSIIDELELMAIEEVKSYLNGRFDTDFIFSRTGSNRNALIKRIIIDFINCYLFERVSGNEIPSYLETRCEKNVELLKNIAKGIISPDLQLKDPILNKTTGFKSGSEIKFIDSNKN